MVFSSFIFVNNYNNNDRFLFLDSFSAVTRIARLPLTGHSCSQTPHPIQRAGSMCGRKRRICISQVFPGSGGGFKGLLDATVMELLVFSIISLRLPEDSPVT